tara:strand:- start:24664 stop:24846 length:183 start_codon:yes stop_codon:yes gene_type:complete
MQQSRDSSKNPPKTHGENDHSTGVEARGQAGTVDATKEKKMCTETEIDVLEVKYQMYWSM